MVFILNLLIYLFFAWVMSSMARRSYELYGDSDETDKYEWAMIWFFTAISAFRWNTGVDSVGYLYRFVCGFVPDEDNTEHLYNYVTNYIADNHIPYFIGTGLLAFGQIFPIVKSVSKFRYILITMPYVMFGNCYFLSYMNGVRQMVVASMFVYACYFILRRQVLKYAIFILVGSLIHHSALMLVPIFALAYFQRSVERINAKRNLLLGIYLACVIIGFTPSFQSVVSYAEAFSNSVGYENYTDRVGEFLGGGYNDEVHNFGLMMMSYFLLGVFSIWYGPMLQEKYSEKIPCFNLWYFLAVAYASLYFLICNVSHIFIRPVLYLLPFQLIIVSLLLWELLRLPQLKNVAVAFIIIIWSECSWNLYKNQMPNACSNYHLVWFHDISSWYRNR